jgi:hypothetical protein
VSLTSPKLTGARGQYQLDFVVVGPQKAGTTWIDEVLRRHSDVVLPSKTKETFFFDQRYSKGLSWYWRHFEGLASCQKDPKSGALRIGEVGPSYFADDDARMRIANSQGRPKIIIALRDPIDRCYSLYRHHFLRGRMKGSFGEALRRYPELIDSGRYRHYCAAWAADFGATNVLLVNQAKINDHAADIAMAIFAFIGVRAIDLGDVNFRANDQIQPANLAVARSAAVLGRAMRRIGAHGLMNLLKQSPVYTLVAKGGRADAVPAPTLEDRQFLAHSLSDDVQWVRQFKDSVAAPYPVTDRLLVPEHPIGQG